MPPDDRELSKFRRTYALLLLALVVLVLTGITVAVVFYRLVASGPVAPLPRPPASSRAPTDAEAAIESASLRRAGPLGVSGKRGKFGLRTPGIRLPAENVQTNNVQSHAVRIEDADLIAAPPVPPVIEEFRNEYGGPFDFQAPGAGFDVLVGPGQLCLNLHRPEVEVKENETLVYTLRGQKINGCELGRSVTLCMNLLGGLTGAAQAPAETLVGPGTDADAFEERLRRWHEPASPGAESQTTTSASASVRAVSRKSREALAGARNSYIGNDPTAWIAHAPGYERLRYPDVFPGVDLLCYADRNLLDLVFVIWPGGNPDDIRLSFGPTQPVELNADGNLELPVEAGLVVQQPPVVYRAIEGRLTPVHGRYVLEEDIARYQPNPWPALAPPPERPPVLDYLTTIGGPDTECAYAMAVDDQGCAYLAGETAPPSPGRADEGGVNVFVSKYRIGDNQPLYTTIIGGRGDERAFGVAVDRAGNAYVCGETMSPDFPATNVIAGVHAGTYWDAFLVKLDANGCLTGPGLRLGGDGDDRACAVALDARTNVYLAGETSSRDFPATRAFCGPRGGGRVDAFGAKLNLTAASVLYIATIGGTEENRAYALAVDDLGNAYLAGETSSRDFPVSAGSYRAQPAGGMLDGFLLRLDADGARLLSSSYLGGSGDDRALALAVDRARNVYIAGETSSADFPTLKALQPRHGGGNWDAFAARFSAGESAPAFSTYLGGAGDDRAFAVVPDAVGRVHIAGATTSADFPSVKPLEPSHGDGEWDGFVARLDATGGQSDYSSCFGGDRDTFLYAAAVDGSRELHVSGSTAATNLAVVRPQQTAYGGGSSDVLAGGIRAEPPVEPLLQRVAGGGQPDGPRYTFYMSKYETTNQEFVRFLNDAEANTNNLRGTNLFFDATGNVWINPAMEKERDEAFDIRSSRLVYDPDAPLGSRYSVTPRPARNGGAYSNHPIVGVSWYGAVKYCNWLTLDAGRGAEERCYREGTNGLDWAPVTCAVSNWTRGFFNDGEREAWLAFKGFRLPMDNCAGPPVPAYDPLRVTNEQFARFLNDAESSPADSARCANMYWDEAGNVWLNPARRPGRDEMFTLAASRLVYEPLNPAGRRCRVVRASAPDGGSYGDYPANGVSWLGAMKYCNWLTLDSGLGLSARRYREGASAEGWAPVTLPEADWLRSEFTKNDKREWSRIRGFGLPLDTCGAAGKAEQAPAVEVLGASVWANAYNEFYKAAAWNGKSNVSYGFGRNTFSAQDGNYLGGGALAWHDTTPAGFYDGSSREGLLQTRTNENHYEICDLSGNVAEWLTCLGQQGSSLDRAAYGGSWFSTLPRIDERSFVHPYFTSRMGGIRVMTTASPHEMFIVRVPYRVYLCAYGYGPGAGRPQPAPERPGEAPEGVPGTSLTVVPSESIGPKGITLSPVVPGQPVPAQPVPPPGPEIPEESAGML